MLLFLHIQDSYVLSYEIGGGLCDDFPNNEICNYDGGDCCGEQITNGFCTKCQCLDPKNQKKISKILIPMSTFQILHWL